MTKMVSVILPIYNVEKYIEQCLVTVCNQTLREIEIICIDDGSTDSSLNIVQKLQKTYSNILIICQENQGAGIARNRGIEKAEGEFVAFMDPDDYYPDRDVLKKLYTCAKKNKVDIVGGSLNVYKEERENSARNNYSEVFCFDESRLWDYRDYQLEVGYWRFIYRTDFLRRNNIRFPSYRRFQDPPFFVNAMIAAQKFYAISDPVYVYRITDKLVNYCKPEVIDGIGRGLSDLLSISKNHSMERLHTNTVQKLIMYTPYFYKLIYLGSDELYDLLDGMYKKIDKELLIEDCRHVKIKSLLSKSEIDSLYEKIIHREQCLQEVLRTVDHVVIYGAGDYGKQFYSYLEEIHYTGQVDFVISNSGENGTACGKKIYGIYDFEFDRSKVMLFILKKGTAKYTMKQTAETLGYKNIQMVDGDELKMYLGQVHKKSELE